MKKYIIIPVLLLIFYGCGTITGAGDKTQGTGSSAASSKSATAEEGDVTLPTGFLPGKTVTNQLFTAYGEPEKVTEETKKNIQAPEYTDTIRTYYYKDFSCQILESGYSGDEILLETIVSGKGIELKNKLEIGLTRARVYELLGFPAMEDDISMIFYLQEGKDSQAYEYYLKMENEKVAMIVISGYIF